MIGKMLFIIQLSFNLMLDNFKNLFNLTIKRIDPFQDEFVNYVLIDKLFAINNYLLWNQYY